LAAAMAGLAFFAGLLFAISDFESRFPPPFSPEGLPMGLFLYLTDISGESTDGKHPSWIRCDSASMPVFRSIPSGAVDQQRTKGETTLGDCSISRQLDMSSPKIMLACAQGTFYTAVNLDFTTTIAGNSENYLSFVFNNAIITSYSVSGNDSGMPLPSESMSINFTGVSMMYTQLNNSTGAVVGTVPVTFILGSKGT
jgi:type VI secretion system secreted protein Hcp